ncbi:predicted protein [Nematostella vectensis]|uniref:Potassium channel tetramerisation-type BTB domain-containing protein n=1 Tax=Nematostella vectensis TaxID=45351 RepID=A7SM10_NEMVE|nr:predicted protein [Nematostella vectensis]|eukprot:XP_001627331.1 predicted protein [Nematostella vectensis]
MLGKCQLITTNFKTPMKSEKQTPPDVIPLNVGGCYFVTRRSTLMKDSDSMLAVMFSGRHHLDTDNEGRYFIDRDGTLFKHGLGLSSYHLLLSHPSALPQSGTAHTSNTGWACPPTIFLYLTLLPYLNQGRHTLQTRVGLVLLPSSLSHPFSRAYLSTSPLFYQIQRLIERLERYANVFALKLNNAKKFKLGDSFDAWKNNIIRTAQERSMESLSSTGRVNFVCAEDRKMFKAADDCIGQLEHSLVVTSPGKDRQTCCHESYEQVLDRIAKPDLELELSPGDTELFARLTERELRTEGYTCRVWREEIRCNNVRKLFGIGLEECELKLVEYYVEFEWPEPESACDRQIP